MSSHSVRSSTPIRFAFVGASIAFALAGCGNESPDATSPSIATATPPVAAAAITEGGGTFGSAMAAACDMERKTIDMAMEVMIAMRGDAPIAEADLVTGGMLREESALYDVGEGNVVVPSPTGGCTS